MKNSLLKFYSLINYPLNMIGLELTFERKVRSIFHKRIKLLKKRA